VSSRSGGIDEWFTFVDVQYRHTPGDSISFLRNLIAFESIACATGPGTYRRLWHTSDVTNGELSRLRLDIGRCSTKW
jgi:hypothetical protein